MFRTIAVCSLIIAATAALWLWLDRREVEAVTVEATALSAPPRIVPAEIEAPRIELRSAEESAPPSGTARKENAPQTLLLSPGERKAITVSVAGKVRLQLHSQVPVSFAFGTVQGEMFADFDAAVRSGACFAEAVTDSTKECSVASGASLLIEDARPVTVMVPQAIAAVHSKNPTEIVNAIGAKKVLFIISTSQ